MNMNEQMNKAKEFVKEILNEEQFNIIEKVGFFSAPASTQRHLSVKGGLAVHSCNVTETMLNINESLNLGLNREWVIMAGMLHDLAKVGYYEDNILKNGKQSEAKPYKWNPKFLMPHGTDSLYLLINDLGLKIPLPVASSITYHMGEFGDSGFSNIVDKLSQLPVDMMLTWLLQTADRYSTWITEVELK